MRDETTYLKNKLEEIELLNTHVQPPLNLKSTELKSSSKIFNVKMELRKRMLQNFYFNHSLFSETNFTHNEQECIESYTVSSTYQRFDMTVLHENYLDHIYRTNSCLKSVGKYTACGMAAITSVLFAFNSLYSNVRVVLPQDAYYETIYLAKTYLLNVKLAHDFLSNNVYDANILWYDSISQQTFSEFQNDLDKSLLDFVVVDTTCYELGSQQIDKLLDWLQLYNIPCVLLRRSYQARQSFTRVWETW